MKDKKDTTETTQQNGNGDLANVSGLLPDWDSFKAGFEAARDVWNEKYATEPDGQKWILLPDKLIANAWWKWLKGNDR